MSSTTEKSDAPLLKVVDACDLDDELRSLLRPGEMVQDEQGRRHHLPRYFYEVPSQEAAVSIRLTQYFGLNELLLVDLKEAPRLQQFPCYIPCAVRLLANYLEQFRAAAGARVPLAVNRGDPPPPHKLAPHPRPHMGGTPPDILPTGPPILKPRRGMRK